MNKYVIGYVAGYGENGTSYVTIVEADTAQDAVDKLWADKKAEPFAFHWMEIQSVQTVEDYHKGI